MKDKFLKFAKVSSIKDIAVLSSGVFIAQLIGFFLQPIATRLYTVEMFGKLSLIISLVNIFSPVLTLTYDQCIVVAQNEREANILTALSLRVGLIISCIVTIGLIIYNNIFPSKFAEVGRWIYFSIPLLFISIFVQITTMYNNRYEQYKLMASVSVVRSVFFNATKIILGLLKLDFWGLILSTIISTCAGIKRQSRIIIENIENIKSVNKDEIISVAKKYKNQPLFSAPGIFVNTYSYNVLPLFISSLYGVKEAGFFSQSMLILGLPLTLISNSVAQVYFKNASRELAETGNFFSSFKLTAKLLLLLSFIPFIVLWFTAEPMFSFVFGAEWLMSGTFVKLLIPMYFIRFTVTALTESLIIVGKQSKKLLIQCIFALEATLAYIITKYYKLSIESFLSIINYSYLINYLVIFFVVWYESKCGVQVEYSKLDRENAKY